MGANVRISTVAIAQGNLTIRVTETPEVSQPGPFSRDYGRRAAHQHRDRRSARQEVGGPEQQRYPARPGGQPECAGCRAARPDQHSAVDQGRRRPAGRSGGALMTKLPAMPVPPAVHRAPGGVDARRRPPIRARWRRRRMISRPWRSDRCSSRCSIRWIPRMGCSAAAAGEEAWKPMLVQEFAKQIARPRRARAGEAGL